MYAFRLLNPIEKKAALRKIYEYPDKLSLITCTVKGEVHSFTITDAEHGKKLLKQLATKHNIDEITAHYGHKCTAKQLALLHVMHDKVITNLGAVGVEVSRDAVKLAFYEKYLPQDSVIIMNKQLQSTGAEGLSRIELSDALLAYTDDIEKNDDVLYKLVATKQFS